LTTGMRTPNPLSPSSPTNNAGRTTCHFHYRMRMAVLPQLPCRSSLLEAPRLPPQPSLKSCYVLYE
jgi:hypothetical protein